MSRCRMVSETNGRRHVSSVLVSEEEATEMLQVEAELHALAGWIVTRGSETVVCRRGRITRVLSVRRSDAMTDSVREGAEK